MSKSIKNKKSLSKNLSKISVSSIEKFIFRGLKPAKKEVKNYENRAGIIRKSLASAADSLILLFARGIILQIYGMFILSKSLPKFRDEFIFKFGNQVPKFTPQHADFILHHSLFIEILSVIAILVFVGVFYHGLLLASKWQATIGKRIFEIYVVGKSGEKISALRGGFYYLLSLLPFFYLIHIICYSAAYSLPIYEAITGSKVNLLIGLIFAIWLQFSFFVRSKATASELALGIKLMEGRV